MKKILKIAFVLTLSIGLITLNSCDDDDNNQIIQQQTIVDLAVGNSNLSILVQALQRAELVTALQGGPYTVFAPTNAAFEALLEDLGVASLNDIPVPTLKTILLNHVVSGTRLASSLTNEYVETLAVGAASSTKNLNMYINVDNGVRLNGISSVVTPNVLASNGVVHVVDAVITLPTVVTFATADPNFSTLVTALTELTPNTDFVSILSTASGSTTSGYTAPFTVFAPTNAAFDALANEIAPTTIPGLGANTLTSVLLYHVSPGNILSSALTPNGSTTVNTALSAQRTFTITLPGTNGNIANTNDQQNRAGGIIAVDIQADNGVIHVLNRVLLFPMA